MEEYLHIRPRVFYDLLGMMSAGSFTPHVSDILFERLIPYKDSQVLALQKGCGYHDDTRCVVVPGIVHEYQTKCSEFGLPISSVEPVNKHAKRNLKKIIEDAGLVGPINFW